MSFEWTTGGFLHKIWGHPRKSADNPGDIEKPLDALFPACHDAYHSDEHQLTKANGDSESGQTETKSTEFPKSERLI